MSSGAILSQIQHCEWQIQEKQAEIAKLRQLLEQQEQARSKCNGRAPAYEDAVSWYERKVSGIESVAHDLRCAQKAGYVMGDHKSNRNNAIFFLDDIETSIKREIEKNRELLYMAERDKSNLQQRLSYLGNEYQNALNREAKEAAAAAAAAM